MIIRKIAVAVTDSWRLFDLIDHQQGEGGRQRSDDDQGQEPPGRRVSPEPGQRNQILAKVGEDGRQGSEMEDGAWWPDPGGSIPRKAGTRTRWPSEEMGRNSVTP